MNFIAFIHHSYLLKLIFGISWKLKGAENLPSSACVIISNHQSHWEAIAFYFLFPFSVPVLKKEILSYPLIGLLLSYHLKSFIIVDRSQKRKSLALILSQGAKAIARGRQVYLFPEGIRNTSKTLLEYQIGAAALASKMNVVLLPIAINSGEFYPSKTLGKKRGTITLSIGKPFFVSDIKEATQRAREWTQKELLT